MGTNSRRARKRKEFLVVLSLYWHQIGRRADATSTQMGLELPRYSIGKLVGFGFGLGSSPPPPSSPQPDQGSTMKNESLKLTVGRYFSDY